MLIDRSRSQWYGIVMVQERRRSQRVRAYLPVRLHQPGAPQVVETLTKDLSEGGFRCLNSTLCPISTELGVDLVLSTGNEQLSLRGKAVWFRTIPESEQFDFGIAFVELSPETKRRLSAYLDRLAKLSSFALA